MDSNCLWSPFLAQASRLGPLHILSVFQTNPVRELVACLRMDEETRTWEPQTSLQPTLVLDSG